MERKILGSYVGSPQDMKELMELVNAGKVDPIPVEQRPISEVNAALADLKDGKVLGRLSLIHD
jgi:D-arabinose 1-dehydrogenase-like Zn-dependent alcohol dehydrogenase